MNDIVSVEGNIVSKEYQNSKDGSTNHFLTLTAYSVKIIATFIEEDNENEVPF